MAVPIVLTLQCRNCGRTYTFTPPYTTYSTPPDDFDTHAVDANAANRAPRCPTCNSWAAQVLKQVGG